MGRILVLLGLGAVVLWWFTRQRKQVTGQVAASSSDSPDIVTPGADTGDVALAAPKATPFQSIINTARITSVMAPIGSPEPSGARPPNPAFLGAGVTVTAPSRSSPTMRSGSAALDFRSNLPRAGARNRRL